MSEHKVSQFKSKFEKKFEKFLKTNRHEKFLFSGVLSPAEKRIVRTYAKRANLKYNIVGSAKKVYVSITKPQRSDDKFRRNNSQHSTVVTLSPTSDRLIRELLLDEPSPMEECNIQISFDATEMNDALISREQHTPVVPPMPRTSNPFRESRKTLPTYAYRERILDAIENNQVILISSETGSGKTTQVPQYIMEDCAMKNRGCRIVCTQPRRLAATSISERVANERMESNGKSVGYRIRLQNCSSDKTNLIFTTSGYLLRCLLNSKSYEFLRNVTYLIVDEVHEREKIMDFLLIGIREAIAVAKITTKIILMSATMDATIFSEYFDNCPIIDVHGNSFAVDIFFLEDVLATIQYESRLMKCSMQNARRQLTSKFSLGTDREDILYKVRLAAYQQAPRHISEIDHSLLTAVVAFIHKTKPLDGSLLIFLPGFDDISKQKQLIDVEFKGLRDYQLILLHGSLHTFDAEKQREVFERSPDGQRKIILSTNIAEMSVTIDDVVIVIDCGKEKQMRYDVDTDISSLSVCAISKACAKQRAGRAGRTRNGECWRLYSHEEFIRMQEYTVPEIQRLPLHDICLFASVFGAQSNLTIDEFLNKALQPPSAFSIQKSVQFLQKIDALDENERPTILGAKLADMPVDIRFAKCILYGVLFACVEPIIAIVSALSTKDPYTRQTTVDSQRMKWIKKDFAAKTKSDHFMLMHTLHEWQYCRDTFQEKFFCLMNMLNDFSMVQIDEQYAILMKHLHTIGYIKANSARDMEHLNRNSNNWPVIKACLTAGLYPNVCENNRNAGRLLTPQDQNLHVHTSSVLVNVPLKDGERVRWMLYGERSRINHITIAKSNSLISDVGVALFTGPINLPTTNIFPVENRMASNIIGNQVYFWTDDWINFVTTRQNAHLLYGLRSKINRILIKFLMDPSLLNADDARTLDVLYRVLNAEEQFMLRKN